MTGVSRERLRTWERRHNFPKPHRENQGPRRYAVADAAKVIAARRLIEQNIPVATAISRVETENCLNQPIPSVAFSSLCEVSPIPTLIISGPSLLQVEYINFAARSIPQAPLLGSKLEELFEERHLTALREAFAYSTPHRSQRPRWHQPEMGVLPIITTALTSMQEKPLVAVFDLETRNEQIIRSDLERSEQNNQILTKEKDRLSHQLETCLLIANELKGLSGTKATGHVTQILIDRLGAVDAALVPYVAGQLVLSHSISGLLGSEMIAVAAHNDLQELLHATTTRWLKPDTAALFGVPEDLHVLASSIACAEEPMGLLLAVFDHQNDPANGLYKVMGIISGDIGLAMMQERLLETKFPSGFTFF